MLMNFLFLNFIMSLIFIFMNHPLSLGLILLIQTFIISMITGNMNYNFWYSYILFLILIGGMLILFIYMTSIASNEKFNFKMKIMMLFFILTNLFFLTPYILYFMNFYLLNKEILKFNHNFSFISMNKFINMPMNFIMIFLIIYLLITLISVVKIINLKYGPLRQMN